MRHTGALNIIKGGEVSFFMNVRKHIFVMDYQNNTTICLLQPKVFGRNHMFLCTNYRFIISMGCITINNIVLHLVYKYLYFKHTMQNKLSHI